MATETQTGKRVAPYLPFATFLGSFDVFSQGVPPKLDRSLWRSQSGLMQGQIMNAYRFLYLVDDDDAATEYLSKMAIAPEQRPETMRELIEAQYADVLSDHDVTKMTLKMLEESFEKNFSASGATKQKAITFFLKAAKFSDMPLSSFLQSQLRNTSARKKRGPKPREPNGDDTPRPANPAPNPAPSGAISHSVRLVSGGTLTVTITANPFSMPTDDRTFVFTMIDKVQEYEKQHPVEQEEEE